MINKSDKIFVAGHRGMVGSAILRVLQKRGFENLICRTRQELDLKDTLQVRKFFSKEKPQVVILAAARVGGIKANQENLGAFLYENLSIQNNVIHESYRNNVQTLCILGSSCIYPRECPQPMKEEYLLTGPLEPTNEGYALAKIAGLKMIEFYRKQYGLHGMSVMPCNLYGTNDSFDLENCHVLSALVRKFVNAVDENRPEVIAWGTGKARREFMHVDDAAEAILYVIDHYDSKGIVNIGWGQDITIRELTELIAKASGFKGKVVWDTTKSDGMPRKCMDVSRMKALGFSPRITLEEGVDQTIREYRRLKRGGHVVITKDSGTRHPVRETPARIPLMKHAFLNEPVTKRALADFIIRADRLSMSQECLKFESAFGALQKSSEAVLFNSGGSANLAMIQSLKNLQTLKDGDAVGFSGLTWSTNVMPLIQLNLKPVPLDCDPTTLNTMSRHLKARLKTTRLKVLFVTNVLGYAGDLDNIRDICADKKITLMEDNCEALGTELPSGRTGSFGVMASFSFFVAHHMSTVEGGMVTTNDENLAEMLRIVRANGWDRNLRPDQKDKLRRRHKIPSQYESVYTFYDLGYNLRPTEITGFLGCHQLQFLEENIQKREQNFARLDGAAKQNKDLIILDKSHIRRLSSFAYPVMCRNRKLRETYRSAFDRAGVETRPMIAGNIEKQPFYRKYVSKRHVLPGVDQIHSNGFYCGNYPELTDDDLVVLSTCLKKRP